MTWWFRVPSRLFFLDYFACSKLDPEAGAKVVAGIAEGCRFPAAR